MLFAAEGAEGSTVNDVVVSDNVLTGSAITAQVTHLTRRTNIVFTNNVSHVTATSGPYNGPILNFAHVDGLTVTGNVQPLAAGAVFIRITDSTRVVYR
jgi:hypothetical protein